MSQLQATITEIKREESLNIVKFNMQDVSMTMMSLDVSDTVQLGSKVKLAVNPTHVALAKGFNGELSYANQFYATVLSCTNGKLLSSIKLIIGDEIIESIITLESSLRMSLKVDDRLTVLIKASELSIIEMIDD